MKIGTMILIAALGTSLSTASAVASADQTTTRTAADHKAIPIADFFKKAGASGVAEVEMGKLGAEKATNPQVKAFAQKMVIDHTKANQELLALAKSKEMEVPDEPGLVHKGMKEKFEHQAADRDFDHDFMQQMVRDHKEAVELFATAAGDTTLDVDVRAWANKTLPALKKHLADAEKLEAKLVK